MPRHARPRAVAEITGAVRHDPQRYRPTPKVAPLGPPPGHLCEDAQAEWIKFAAEITPGVLGAPDRVALEILVNLVIEHRRDPPAFATGKYSAMRSLMARFVGSEP